MLCIRIKKSFRSSSNNYFIYSRIIIEVSLIAPIERINHSPTRLISMHRSTLSRTAPWRMHQFFNDTCNQWIFYSQRWRSIDYRASRRRVASRWRLWISRPRIDCPLSCIFFSFFFSDKQNARGREKKTPLWRPKKFFLRYAKRITNFEICIRGNCPGNLAVFFLYFNILYYLKYISNYAIQTAIQFAIKIVILRRENPFGEEQLFLNNTEVLYASHFNESRPTKFIVHGFSDTGNEGWIRDLINGGRTWMLRRNLRIIFYHLLLLFLLLSQTIRVSLFR